MRKPTIDDLKLWHIVVGGQYLLLGCLALLGTALDHFYGRGVDLTPLFLGAAFYVLASFVAFVCSVAEKSVAGALIATAPFYLPFLANLL